MTSKTLLTFAVAGALCFAAGCGLFKKEESTDAPPPPPPGDSSAAPTDTPAATGEEVAKYDNMVPQGGTKRTLQAFKVYQAADPKSKLLTNLGPNTFIDLKGSYGNWMLIDWPCGVAKLCPGWIELKVNDSRVADSPKPDAGVPADAGAATDAGAAADAGAATDAGARDGGRRRIELPKKP